jgi:hypothetical protein
MRVERAQVEEVSVTYCAEDLRAMLRFEDSDGAIKPIPKDATLHIDGDQLRVRFFQERTVTNDIPGIVVGEPVKEDSRFQFTLDDVKDQVPDDSTGAWAVRIYGLLLAADEPMTSKDILAALKVHIGPGPIRRGIAELEKITAIEYCGGRYPQVRDNKQLRRMNSYRPTRRKEEPVTSEE